MRRTQEIPRSVLHHHNYVTATGRSVMTTGLKLKTLVVIPEIARAMSAGSPPSLAAA
jgi:hypothetical protein